MTLGGTLKRSNIRNRSGIVRSVDLCTEKVQMFLNIQYAHDPLVEQFSARIVACVIQVDPMLAVRIGMVV